MLRKEISTWYVDNTEEPTISESDGEYFIAEDESSDQDAKVGNKSENVNLETNKPGGEADWCVHVTNENGDVAADPGFEYAAQGGLAEGNCDK